MSTAILCITTFGVHVQAVGLAAIAGGHVMVADGDVEGVTARDVVTQRLPVHRDQPRPGLRDLQSLGGPHGFYSDGARNTREKRSTETGGGNEVKRHNRCGASVLCVAKKDQEC